MAGAAVVHFAPGWREWVEGQLRPGRGFDIVYEGERVIECFGAVPPSAVVAEAEFFPGGELRSRRLADGTARFTAPRGSNGVALWFHAESSDGGLVWDTRFGENYRYPIGRT